jgi:hypothetical protein
MKKKVLNKEYNMMRIGDSLEACIHRTFTNEADDMLYRGIISRDERILLSGAISRALDSFHAALPSDLSNRQPYLDSGPAEEAVPVMREVAGNMLNKVVNWLGLVKAEFDTSPWNGSASQWDTAEAYCSDCLIDTNPSGAKKTKDKCHLPYRSPGSSSINKNALRAMASGARGISALKGVPAEEKARAAKWVVSHWKAAFDRPAPDSMYHMAGMTPPKAGEKSSVLFFKDKDQKWWVMLMYSNKYEDRETDIVSEAAHLKFAEFCQKSGFKPQIVLFHLPKLSDTFWLNVYHKYHDSVEKMQEIVHKVYRDTGSAIAEAERVTYLNGFALMMGRVYPEKYAVAEKLAGMKDLGNSHTFIATDFKEKDDSGIIVNNYISFEGTILPRSRAANVLTFTALKEKVMNKIFAKAKGKAALSETDQQWLESVLGKEGAAALVENTKDLEKTLDPILAFKQATEEVGPEETPAEDEAAAEEIAAEETVSSEPDDPAEEVVGKVLEVLNIEELQGVVKSLVDNNNALVEQNKQLVERIVALEGKVVDLNKSEDEKIAAKYMPVNWGIPNLARPSESKETELSDKKAAKAIGDGPTLPEGAGGDDNMLAVGLWNNLKVQPVS